MSFQYPPGGGYQQQQQSAWSSEPWVWVAIPAAIVVAIGAIAVFIHRRRRRRLRQAQVLADPNGAQALERDLWEMWGRNGAVTDVENGRPHAAANAVPGGAGGRWTRSTSRWAWVGGARTEEGLNELGEAPPPYDPRAAGQAGNKIEGPRNGVGEEGMFVDEPLPALVTDGMGGPEVSFVPAGLSNSQVVMSPPPDYPVGERDPEQSGNSPDDGAGARSTAPGAEVTRPEPAVLHHTTPTFHPGTPAPPSPEAPARLQTTPSPTVISSSSAPSTARPFSASLEPTVWSELSPITTPSSTPRPSSPAAKPRGTSTPPSTSP